MVGSVSVVKDLTAKLKYSLTSVTKSSVYVGIPASTADRDSFSTTTSDTLSNAEIAYIQSKGAPEHNLPARPFLEPGVLKVQDKLASVFRKIGKNALEGNTFDVVRGFEAAGLIAQVSAKKIITDGIAPALADSTLRGRDGKGAAKELRRREAGKEASTDFAKPLIDTGQLLNSITYVVRKS